MKVGGRSGGPNPSKSARAEVNPGGPAVFSGRKQERCRRKRFLAPHTGAQYGVCVSSPSLTLRNSDRCIRRASYEAQRAFPRARTPPLWPVPSLHAGWEGREASWGERSERAGGGEAPRRRCLMIIHRAELSTAEEILIQNSRFVGGEPKLHQRLARFIVSYGGVCVRAWGFCVSGGGRNVSYGGRVFRVPAGRVRLMGGFWGSAEGGAGCGLDLIVSYWGRHFRIVSFGGRFVS